MIKVESQMNSELASACRKVLVLKDRLDTRLSEKDFLDEFIYKRMISSGRLSSWNERAPGESKVIRGDEFAKLAIPFCQPHRDTDQGSIQHVNPFNVLGGSYYEKERYDDVKAHRLADTLDIHSQQGGQEEARYVKIGPFDIYVPGEGKNRVSIYRQINRPIVAKVFETKFPPPNALTLHKVLPWKDMAALSYNGNDSAFNARVMNYETFSRCNTVLLPFSESVRLFEVYGVKWGRSIVSFGAMIQIRKIRLKIGHAFYVR